VSGSFPRVERLLEGGDFYEGLRWHDGRWWVSDFYRSTVTTVDASGRAEEVLRIDGEPSGLGWLPDGSLLVVSMSARRILRWPGSGEPSVYADLASLLPGSANDMVVGPAGDVYVGNFGFDLMTGEEPRPTQMVHVDPSGRAELVPGDLVFPNGSVITPDGATLIVAETFGARLSAFDVAADGSLSGHRVWAAIESEGFSPDGIALDADGHIWAADAQGGRVVRVAEGGTIAGELRMPDGLGCFACMLGGEDGRTLLMAAAPDYFADKRRGAGEAVLLTAQVDVPHAGLP
jgi:sugar lactone lactonase YvrE